MAEIDVEKSSYGAFERTLFFATPIIFTVVLLGVLFALFDANVMDSVLRAANKIPVLERIVPDPRPQTSTAQPNAATKSSPTDNAAVEQLSARLKQMEAELQQAAEANRQKDGTIKELEAHIEQLEQQLKTKTQTEEEYRAQIRQLASVYAKMMPSKAAPIIQNLTPKEMVLVLSEMKPDDQVKILERMDPKIAAEASIQIKDLVPSENLQIAALQERLKINEEAANAKPAPLSQAELGRTFSEMAPKSAAAILLEMNAVNSGQVLDILKAMDSAGRSRVLAAIADVSKTTAATLAAKLSQ